jgi:hypothetical protein
MYTPESYLALLELLRTEGYKFVSFDADLPSDQKLVYLRHDIDYSPRWAAEFAILNERAGVSGTFCFQLRSPLYNLAAPQSQDAIRAIESRGQHVALHFAFSEVPSLDVAMIVELVTRDFRIARAIVPTIKPWFSWHNPSVTPGLIERCLDIEVPGVANLYGRRFVRDSVYRSDSNWRFSLEEWRSIVREGHQRLQLLFHPFQWMARGRNMREVLALAYAELARAGHTEFATNRVWSEHQIAKRSEAVFSRIGAMFGAADED